MSTLRSIKRYAKKESGTFKYTRKLRGHNNHHFLNLEKKDKCKRGLFKGSALETIFSAIFAKSLSRD